ncbi:cytochrome b5-like [Bidens hawaiensis]|uniref:cytochrome b5-like n=1 Tax=Bidens hawaiensis TaxID=980011 RepID=UPI00404A6D34
MASDQKIFVFDEVAKHNKLDDCWLIISRKVYDVTLFMDDHPGGGDVWLRATGKDATVDFSDVGHSAIAREKMKKYYVGEIDESTIPVRRSYIRSITEKINNSKNTTPLIVMVLLVGLMAAALGILFAAS